MNVAVDTEEVRTLVIPLPPHGVFCDAELTRIAAADVPSFSDNTCSLCDWPARRTRGAAFPAATSAIVPSPHLR